MKVPWLRSLASLSAISVNLSDVDVEKRRKRNLDRKQRHAANIMNKFKEERGVPGLSVGVNVNGKTIWRQGFGFSDVENLTRCTDKTVMRIASISKPLTMTLAAKLSQDGILDLDLPVQKYVPNFPEKFVDNEKVVLTTRHLVSHLGGIRHYEKINNSSEQNADPASERDDKKDKTNEFQWGEYHNQKQFKSVVEALDMFKNDPLIAKPGAKFHYTTHGWTLVSAVLEGAAKRKFEIMMQEIFDEFNMRQTYFDENTMLIANRSKFYRRSKKNGRLENVPSVNNSYKWAGGGFLSTVDDLLKFADVLLLSYQNEALKNNFLNAETVAKLWTPVENTKCSWVPKRGAHYGMGWCVASTSPMKKIDSVGVVETVNADSYSKRFYVSHTGGAIGASCVLLIKPAVDDDVTKSQRLPKGVSVAILTNLQECGGLNKLALDIAAVFDDETSSN